MGTAIRAAADGSRGAPAVTVGWLMASVGAFAAVGWARHLDDPSLALAGLALLVVVGASVVGGAVAGLGGSVVLGVLTWWWLDPRVPLPAGYEIGLGVGGALVALGIGAAAQLRAFDRERAGWLERLDRLATDLGQVSGSDDPLVVVRDAVRRATGASSVIVDPPPDDATARPTSDSGALLVSSRSSPPLILELVIPEAPPPVLAADFNAFLRSVADQCAHATRRAALEEAEQRASTNLELLARASSALSASLDVDRVLATVSELVVPSLADECTVRIEARPGERRRPGEPAPPDDPRTRTVDLAAHGALIGQLTIRRRDRDLSPEEVAAALLLAEPIGRALDHALLFAEQVRTSSTLERSLLPEAILPIPCLDVATRYLAAAEGHAAGGDFYDVIITPEGSAVLIVGDVQGKGVEAATLTSVARHTLRTAAMRGSGPALMLEELNRALLYGHAERRVASAGEPPIRFVTAAVVSLAPSDRGFHAVVASGGHPPPLVIRPTGAVEQLAAEGVLLGVFDDAHHKETHLELELADILVLYTDGVTEQRAQPDLFNEVQLGRLVRNMRTSGHVDADATAQLILDTVVGLNPREVRDDIALVVARVTGPR